MPKVTHQLLRAGSVTFLISIIGIGLSFLVQIILAKWLGAYEFGVYSYALAIISFLAVLSQAGLHVYVFKSITIFKKQQNWPALKGSLILSNAITTGLSLAVIGIAILVIFAGFKDSESAGAMLYGLPLIALISLGILRQQALRAFKKIAWMKSLESIIPSLIFLLCLLVLSQSGVSADHQMAILIRDVSLFGVFLIGSYLLARSLPKSLARESAQFDVKAALALAMPMFFVSLLQASSKTVDVIILGNYVSMEEVGVYKLISQFAFIILLAQKSINTMSAVLIVEAYSSDNKVLLREIISKSTWLSLLFSLLVFFLLFMVGEALLELVGEDYVTGYPALMYLAVAGVFSAACGPTNTMLTMTGKQTVYLYLLAFSTLLGISLYILLIPEYGIIGAAISYTSFTIIFNLLCTVYIRKYFAINTTIFCFSALGRKPAK